MFTPHLGRLLHVEWHFNSLMSTVLKYKASRPAQFDFDYLTNIWYYFCFRTLQAHFPSFL